MRIPAFIVALLLTAFCYGQKTELQKGDTFPDFAYEGAYAKPYYFKELRGSYVLVHFWSSWNEESRKMQQSYIDIFARYKDRRFKDGRKFYVVSISLDEDKDTWERALKKDNLPWKAQRCDLQGWHSPLIEAAKVQRIPANFLIDPNGRILASNLGPEEIESLLKDR